MLRALPAVLSATLALTAALPAALLGAENPAVRIASAVIRERAHDLKSAGQSAVAVQLETLANGLADGSVTLADAALVMQIAASGNTARSAVPVKPSDPPKPVEPATTPTQVVDILDGKAPEPTATATTTPAAAAPTAVPAGPTSTVLAASRASDGKTTLVMISAGSNQQVKAGQRFTIRRGDQSLSVVSASQVKDTMTICVAIPGSGPADAEIKEGDQVVPAP
jgi:type V secretory pathway adhesin AidA